MATGEPIVSSRSTVCPSNPAVCSARSISQASNPPAGAGCDLLEEALGIAEVRMGGKATPSGSFRRVSSPMEIGSGAFVALHVSTEELRAVDDLWSEPTHPVWNASDD